MQSARVTANTRSNSIFIGILHLIHLHLFRSVEDGWHVSIGGHVSSCISLPTHADHFKTLFFVSIMSIINIDLAKFGRQLTVVLISSILTIVMSLS